MVATEIIALICSKDFYLTNLDNYKTSNDELKKGFVVPCKVKTPREIGDPYMNSRDCTVLFDEASLPKLEKGNVIKCVGVILDEMYYSSYFKCDVPTIEARMFLVVT